MEKVTFTCETITPMFMYGADGKTPELRAASIKGVMRFWWRAINGNLSLKELKEKEGEIFGSTERRSKVNIRVQYTSKEENTPKIEKIPKMAYLFYPFYLDGAEKEKKCFIDLKFEVILSSRDEKALKEACYSFILLSLFGGLGSRSRRGGGNFVITKTSDTNYSQFLLNDIQHLNSIYENIKRYFMNSDSPNEVSNEYSTLSSLNYKISANHFNSCEKALKDIETKYKNFRKNNKLLKNASFGLPIIFEDTKNRVEVVTKPEFERRASPMIIKILKVQENYFWFVFKLNGEFLPNGTTIKEKKDTSYQDIDESIVDEFMESLK